MTNNNNINDKLKGKKKRNKRLHITWLTPYPNPSFSLSPSHLPIPPTLSASLNPETLTLAPCSRVRESGSELEFCEGDDSRRTPRRRLANLQCSDNRRQVRQREEREPVKQRKRAANGWRLGCNGHSERLMAQMADCSSKQWARELAVSETPPPGLALALPAPLLPRQRLGSTRPANGDCGPRQRKNTRTVASQTRETLTGNRLINPI